MQKAPNREKSQIIWRRSGRARYFQEFDNYFNELLPILFFILFWFILAKNKREVTKSPERCHEIATQTIYLGIGGSFEWTSCQLFFLSSRADYICAITRLYLQLYSVFLFFIAYVIPMTYLFSFLFIRGNHFSPIRLVDIIMSRSQTETSRGRGQPHHPPPTDSEDVMEFMFGDEQNEDVRITLIISNNSLPLFP